MSHFLPSHRSNHPHSVVFIPAADLKNKHSLVRLCPNVVLFLLQHSTAQSNSKPIIKHTSARISLLQISSQRITCHISSFFWQRWHFLDSQPPSSKYVLTLAPPNDPFSVFSYRMEYSNSVVSIMSSGRKGATWKNNLCFIFATKKKETSPLSNHPVIFLYNVTSTNK